VRYAETDQMGIVYCQLSRLVGGPPICCDRGWNTEMEASVSVIVEAAAYAGRLADDELEVQTTGVMLAGAFVLRLPRRPLVARHVPKDTRCTRRWTEGRPLAARPGSGGFRTMKALVTGVAGFIGSTLAERLADGADVVGLDCFTDYYPRPS
jgi:hypothetical protein